MGAPAAPAAEASSCDRVLCWFVAAGSGYEWHVYDLVHGTDTVLLTLNGPPSFVEWDTTRTQVEFLVERGFYQADWKVGSAPRLVARLPDRPGICDVWFNPDSLRWQFYTSEGTGPWTKDGHYPLRRYVELWQPSRDGREWHRVYADTLGSTGGWCGHPDGGWEDGLLFSSPRARRVLHVTASDLTDAISPDDPIETPPPDCEYGNSTHRYYAALRTATNRGLEFNWIAPRAPEENCATFPIHLVDRKHGTRRMVCDGDPCSNQCVELSEACGFLLVNCDWREARLIDITSRAEVRNFGEDTGVFWAPTPRGATPR